MLDEQDKLCTVKLDEYLTKIHLASEGKKPDVINLAGILSANILTKVGNNYLCFY